MMDYQVQEFAVLQVLVTRQTEGQVCIGIRDIAKYARLSRTATNRIMDRLQSTGQLVMANSASGPNPPTWILPVVRDRLLSQKASQLSKNDEENAIPTMPLQPLHPSGVGSGCGWYERVFRQIADANLKRHSGKLKVNCRKCSDVGYLVAPNSIEYQSSWLRTCDCEVGQDRVLPDEEEYQQPLIQSICPLCENTGWVYVNETEVQRCAVCQRTYA